MTGAGNKQVLLSNCMNLDLGGPSFEIALQEGRVTASLVTDAIISASPNTNNALGAIASVPYQVGQWQVLTMIYDGTDVKMALEGQGTPAIDSQNLFGKSLTAIWPFLPHFLLTKSASSIA